MESNYVGQYESLERAHWWWTSRRRFILDLLRRHAPPGESSSPPRLLEIGCGAGVTLATIGDQYDRQGVEPDDRLRDAAARNSGCPIVAGSLPGPLPFDDGSFDVCLALDVIEHVEQDHLAMAEIRRLLRPGGVFVVNVPAMPSLWSVHDEANHHFRRYTRSGLETLLRSARMRVESLRHWGTALVPLVWLERNVLRRNEGKADYLVKIPSFATQAILGTLTRVDYLLNPFRRWWGTSLLAVCRV